MTPLIPPRSVTLNLADVFAAEVDEARRLGFKLLLNIEQGAVAARMQPSTGAAVSACLRASGRPGQEIESAAQTNGSMEETLDALRDAIRSVLERAREVMA